MSGDNTVTISGNLTRDPELKYTESGKAIVRFGIAVNHRWFNKQSQEWDEQGHFFDVVAWDVLAENVAESLEKGNRVIVSGRVDYRAWEADDGTKRSKVEIVASDVGPSLRWDQADVVRVDHGGGGDKAKASASKGRSVLAEDEEPF